MKTQHLRTAVLALVLAQAVEARGAFPIAVEFFDASGAPIESSVPAAQIAGALPGLAFVHAWTAGLDAVTGRPTGDPRLETLEVTVPIDRVGVRLMEAMKLGERLEKVIFHFFWPAPDGVLEEFFRITVEGVHIESLRAVHPSLFELQNPLLEPFQVIGLVYETAELDGDVVRVERLRYLRGDLNGDLEVDLSDVITLLLGMFRGRSLSCSAAGDIDDDGDADVTDVIYALNYLFTNGPPVPPPFPGCGEARPGESCDASACGPGRGLVGK